MIDTYRRPTTNVDNDTHQHSDDQRRQGHTDSQIRYVNKDTPTEKEERCR